MNITASEWPDKNDVIAKKHAYNKKKQLHQYEKKKQTHEL